MAIKKEPCKNHPESLTTRRCYECKKYICKECQQHHYGHLFCSYYCLAKWRWQIFWKRVPISFEIRIILGFIIITNLVIWIQFTNLSDRLAQSTRINNESEVKGRQDSVYFALDTVRHRITNEINIRIQTNPGFLIGLTRNGKFVESRLAEAADLNFTKLYLDQGENYFSIWAMSGNGNSVLLDSFSIHYHTPRLSYLKKSVRQIRLSQKWLALTFDGGSMRRGSEKVLDILKDLNVKCTIFLTGRFIKSNPDLVRTIRRDGHEVANHTYNHPHLTNYEIDGSNNTRDGIDRGFLYKQLQITDSLLYACAEHRMPLSGELLMVK